MADHVLKYKPGAAVTFTATTDVVGGRVVEVTGDRSVGTAGAATVAAVGVAAFDAKAGESVTVFIGGFHDLVAAGAIAAGDPVSVAAEGKVATGGAYGLAVSSATADGDLVQVVIGGVTAGKAGA